MGNVNCWEVRDCGRGPGGAKVAEFGVCRASVATELHGVHGGVNGGRACWGVIGTVCDGRRQESIADKLAFCVGCTFRDAVEREEESLLGPQDIASRLR